MSYAELKERLAEIVEQRAGANRQAVLADVPFSELGLDSLMVLEVGFFIEQAFGIDFEGKVTAQNLPRHLSDLTAIVHRYLPAAKGG